MKKLICIFLVFYMQLVFAIDVKTYIPTNAYKYMPILIQEKNKVWPDHPKPQFLPALIEQESCIVLTWKSCWNPTTKLDTSREYGAGLGQLTKAYDKNGNIRMDALAGIKANHPDALQELTWNNILLRPDLQMRSVLLLSHDNYKSLYSIKDPVERLNFSDAAYNGGIGGVAQDRRLCGLKANCNPQVWFNNVELTCSKSKVPIYDTRSPCMINRDHVKYVTQIRSDKYKIFFK